MADPTADDAEHWLPIPGYEGYYEVSDLGRVRSLDRIISGGRWGTQRRRGAIRALAEGAHGYLVVSLSRNGKQVNRYVHQLVLEAFVGPRPAGMEACHWDDDPGNARLDNLRWGTRSTNAHDRTRNGGCQFARRIKCPRGHRLGGANNIPSVARRGYRTCLACYRAYADARTLIAQGHEVANVYATADAHYARIAGGARPTPVRQRRGAQRTEPPQAGPSIGPPGDSLGSDKRAPATTACGR